MAITPTHAADLALPATAKPARRFPSWVLIAVCVAAVIATPILSILVYLALPSDTDTWQHLVDTVLADYVSNSLILMLGVAFSAGSMGVVCAWLTSMYSFPGRKILSWALLLPLAMPAYIIAYTYTGMLEFAGPLQSTLREWMGWSKSDYWFPEIRSIGGAITMFSLVLYPYVYLLARAAFLSQSVCALEVSRTLGCGPWQSFTRVALPLARPAIITGISLALMETLADFGTVEYFGVSTFTTGVYRTWFGLYDVASAAKLSAMLLSFVIVLLSLERWSRQKARFNATTERVQTLPEQRPSRRLQWCFTTLCALPLLFGFIIPALQLSSWAISTWDTMVDAAFLTLMLNSFSLAALSALVILIPATLMVYAVRRHDTPLVRALTRLSATGYAIPGTVIAVGVLIPFGRLDNVIDLWADEHFDIRTGLLFSGTLFILVYAYCVRFLTAALNTLESGLEKVKRSVEEAAKTLGCNERQMIWRVHFPIIRGSLLTAVLIVFVDVLKELPATLALRPFNFNTLAVRAYELASDERLADASSAALAIVIVGIIPVLLLSRSITRSRPGHRSPE